MERRFSWQHFDQTSHALESLGYVVVVFGPIMGILLLIFGSATFKLAGLMVVLASLLITLYHFSFSMLMNSIRQIEKELNKLRDEPREQRTASSETSSHPAT